MIPKTTLPIDPSATASARPEATARLMERAVQQDGFYRWLDGNLRSMRRESAILAVGCEEAFLAPHLLEYSSDVTVLDTSGGQLAQLARRFPEVTFLSHHPAKLLPFERRAFDAVCCCEFLDRVFDPVAALREIHRVLAPGGRLLVSVPDHGAVGRMLKVLFRREESAESINPRLHCFNGRSLAKLMRAAGFIDLQTTSIAAPSRAVAESAPRRLLLKATKGPELERILPAVSARNAGLAELFGEEELAFAGRARAA